MTFACLTLSHSIREEKSKQDLMLHHSDTLYHIISGYLTKNIFRDERCSQPNMVKKFYYLSVGMSWHGLVLMDRKADNKNFKIKRDSHLLIEFKLLPEQLPIFRVQLQFFIKSNVIFMCISYLTKILIWQ